MGCKGSKVEDSSRPEDQPKKLVNKKPNNKKTGKKDLTAETKVDEVPKPKYAIYQSSHNAKLQTESDCALRGATFIQNRYMIAADYKNNKLKLFNSKYELLDDLEMPNAPWDVCPAIDNQDDIFATVPFKKEVHRVSFNTVDEQLKSVDTFRTEGFCWGITCFDNGLAVSVKISTTKPVWPKLPDFQVHIHELDGQLRRSIVYDPVGVAFFTEPKYLNVTYDNLFLLVSDYKQNAVLCINNEDELIFSYGGMKSPNGLAMDEHKNVHITSFFGTERVHKVAANGKYVDGLPLTEDRPVFPHCICYRERDKTIVLSTENSLEVYKLV